MEPFKTPSNLDKLIGTYPDARTLCDIAKNGCEQSRAAIARLWLSEGIPFAFKDRPALYESVRSWLGYRLSVDPKDVHLTGSARIGQSLAPHKLGKEFGKHSDLDIFVVSFPLFERMSADFVSWSFDFESDGCLPKNDREKSFWLENLQRGPRNLNRGFIDSGIVPNIERYKIITNIAQSMWLLKSKLDITEEAPAIQGASIRCYKDWGSYVRQVALSLS